MKVSKDELMEVGLPDDGVVLDEVIGKSRWSERHRIVFEWKGVMYQAFYSCGATEMQEEYPWEHEKEVELTEVHSVPITTYKWVPVTP